MFDGDDGGRGKEMKLYQKIKRFTDLGNLMKNNTYHESATPIA